MEAQQVVLSVRQLLTLIDRADFALYIYQYNESVSLL